jgi:hypothetical protein
MSDPIRSNDCQQDQSNEFNSSGYLGLGPFSRTPETEVERKPNMTTMKNRLAALVFGLAIAAATSPSLAQRVDNNNGYPVSAKRAQALRECNARAQPYVQKDWGVGQGAIYRACMAEHGQPE